MSVGNRLLESGHYASQQIQQISSQLEQEWKAFAAALDERSTLLEMSASFHQKADQVQTRNAGRTQKIQYSSEEVCRPCSHTRVCIIFVSLRLHLHIRKTITLQPCKDFSTGTHLSAYTIYHRTADSERAHCYLCFLNYLATSCIQFYVIYI